MLFLFVFRIFFPVVLTPADLWYHSRFPRYRHVTVFVTRRGEEELGILGVRYISMSECTNVPNRFYCQRCQQYSDPKFDLKLCRDDWLSIFSLGPRARPPSSQCYLVITMWQCWWWIGDDINQRWCWCWDEDGSLVDQQTLCWRRLMVGACRRV